LETANQDGNRLTQPYLENDHWNGVCVCHTRPTEVECLCLFYELQLCTLSYSLVHLIFFRVILQVIVQSWCFSFAAVASRILYFAVLFYLPVSNLCCHSLSSDTKSNDVSLTAENSCLM